MPLDHTIILTDEDIINMLKPIPKDKKIHFMMKQINKQLSDESKESLKVEPWMEKYISETINQETKLNDG